jgi:hypothetical protein
MADWLTAFFCWLRHDEMLAVVAQATRHDQSQICRTMEYGTLSQLKFMPIAQSSGTLPATRKKRRSGYRIAFRLAAHRIATDSTPNKRSKIHESHAGIPAVALRPNPNVTLAHLAR